MALSDVRLATAIKGRLTTIFGASVTANPEFSDYLDAICEEIIKEFKDNAEVTVTSSGETAPTVPGSPAAITDLEGEGGLS
jgi:hypothetical protein